MLFDSLVEEVKENPGKSILAVTGIMGGILAIGVLLDSVIDTDKNWDEYLEHLKEEENSRKAC